MLTLLVIKATILLAAGAAVAALRRRAPAGDRHLVWLFTLAGLLALPALLYVTPLRLAILPQELAPASARDLPAIAKANQEPRPFGARAHAPRVAPEDAATVADPAADPRSTAPASRPLALPALPTLLLGLWLTGAIGLAGWLGAGAWTVHRVLRRARPLDDARWRKVLVEVADRLDMADLPRLLSSDRVEVPFASGFSRSTVVLPAAAEDWTDERRSLVLVHELAHVRRRDTLAFGVARLACALYWFHPLVWAAARRLRAESERACDDLVLTCGAKASDYAGLLLDVVSTARRHAAPATAVPMARRRELEGRVLAILDPELKRGQPGRLQSGALLSGLLALLVLVAAAAPMLPAQTPEPAMPREDAVAAPEAAGSEEAAAVEEADSAETPAPAAPAHASASGTVAVQVAQAEPKAQGPQTAPARTAAARPAGDRRPLLLRLLRSDPDASVRRAAAWALSETGRGEDTGVLAAALRGDADAEVREMAAWALSHVQSAEGSAALGEALRRDESDEVRATAAWALGQGERADTTALLAATSDRSPEVKRAAIWAIGQQRLEKAPAPLTAALRDGNPEVRLVAAWALGEIQDPAAEPAVRTAFAAEKDDDVRRALFRTLALLGGPTSDLIDQALASSDPELRQRAVMMAAGKGRGIWPWPWPWPQPRPNP